MPGGFYGLVDFVGYPVGFGVISKKRGGGKGVGGRRWVAQALALLQEERDQQYVSRLRQKYRNKISRQKSVLDGQAERYASQKKLEAATYTLVLAEV